MAAPWWKETIENARHLRGIRILHGGPEAASIREHAHAETQVSVHFRPSRRFGVATVPAHVHLYAPWQPHSGGWEENWEVVVFHLSPELMAETAEEFSSTAIFEIRPFNDRRDGVLEELARVVLSEIRAPERNTRFYVESVGHVVAGHLLRSHAKTHLRTGCDKGLSEKQLILLRHFIEERIESGFTVLELASSVGLGPQRFARQLRLASGLSPWAFVQAQRLTIARQMLKNRRLSLSDIASRLGFTDQSHFTNTFRTNLGTTPDGYRKNKPRTNGTYS